MFGEKLRELRDSYEMTQVQLANSLGVTKQSVSNWENDNILPSVDMLIRIADKFSVTTDFLLERDNRQYIDVTKLTTYQRALVQKLADELEKTQIL